MTAVFSPCGTFRYLLRRSWVENPKRFCIFIMLNPSSADENTDDPTVRRCIGFAKSWGYDGLYVGNVYAQRSTIPLRVWRHAHVGPENYMYLHDMIIRSDLVIAAWGTKANPAQIDEMLLCIGWRKMHCLGATKRGHPKHPLYLRADTTPQEFKYVEKTIR